MDSIALPWMPQSREPPVSAYYVRLANELYKTEAERTRTPLGRKLLGGEYSIIHFEAKAESIVLKTFSALFKRCALLWRLLLNECRRHALKSPDPEYIEQVMLKLGYCQDLCITLFVEAPQDLKKLMTTQNEGSNVFAVEMSAAIVQGLRIIDQTCSSLVATMICFIQEFQRYLCMDAVSVHPHIYQSIFQQLVVDDTSERKSSVYSNNSVDALEIILMALLHSVMEFGWDAIIDATVEQFLSEVFVNFVKKESLSLPLMLYQPRQESDRISLTVKSLFSCKPGLCTLEALLDSEEILLIIQLLALSSGTENAEFSLREILVITRAVTRIPANCIGLVMEGALKILDALLAESDDEFKAYVTAVNGQLLAAVTDSNFPESTKPATTRKYQDTLWGYTAHSGDTDGSIAFICDAMLQLDRLVPEMDTETLSEEDAFAMKSLLFTIFDTFWQSSHNQRIVLADIFGDKYIEALNKLNEAPHGEITRVEADVAYVLLLQEMSKISEHFCEKACAGPLMDSLLRSLLLFQDAMHSNLAQVFVSGRLTALFCFAQLRNFHLLFQPSFEIVPVMLQSPNTQNRLLARLLLALLHSFMTEKQIQLLEMTSEEAQLFIQYIHCPELLGGGLELAKVFMAASYICQEFTPPNVLSIAHQLIDIILQDCSNCTLEGALCLIWAICHDPAIALHLSAMHNFIQVLMYLCQNPCSAVAFPAKATLWKLGFGNFTDPNEGFIYAYTCLHYGSFKECIEWCDHVTKYLQEGSASFAMLRGKAYAWIYKHQLVEILYKGSLDSAVTWRGGNFVDQCANNAKAAVRELGFALDKGMLDEEGSFLLDVAMIDYVKIKKQLKDCNRCLLCRRKGVKLLDSHTIPKFLLKNLYTRSMESAQQLGVAEYLSLDKSSSFVTMSGPFSAGSFNTTLTYRMLCVRCEQCLSQNGEDQFRRNFLPHIYHETEKHQNVEYDSTLYSFCLGILFRSFANNGLLMYPNADELYSVFVKCRNHLLSLTTKYTGSNKMPDVSEPKSKSLAPLNIYLFIGPLTLHVRNINLMPLFEVFHGCSTCSSVGIPYCTEKRMNLCHAYVVHASSCYFFVPLSPMKDILLDKGFLVNPDGGKYQILSDINRWQSIPQGLFKHFTVFAKKLKKRTYEISSGARSNTTRDLNKVSSYIQSNESVPYVTGFELGPINKDALSSIPPEEAKMIASFLSPTSDSVTILPAVLLPEGFAWRFHPRELILKEGYSMLYHVYNDKEKSTFFFIGSSVEVFTDNLIVIMHTVEENCERVEGVRINISKDHSSSSVSVTGFLQEPPEEKLRERQYSRLNAITNIVMNAFNLLIQCFGSPATFLHHARIQMRLKSKSFTDHRCCTDGCWYCTGRCHICLEPAHFGYTLFPFKEAFRHCGANCQAVVSKAPHFNIKVRPSQEDPGSVHKDFILLSIDGCFESILSTYTVVQVIICMPVMNSQNTARSRPYAVVQFRTQDRHIVFSVYLANDFTSTEPLEPLPIGYSFQELKDILSRVFLMSLPDAEIINVLTEAIKADHSLSTQLYLQSVDSHGRTSYQETLKLFAIIRIFKEEDYFDWILKCITTLSSGTCGTESFEVHQSKSQSHSSGFLFSTIGSLHYLFCTYIQLACIEWKGVMNGDCESHRMIAKRIEYVCQVSLYVYEQSPPEIQDCIAYEFCCCTDVVSICARLAVIIITDGGLELALHVPATKFLILFQRFFTSLDKSSAELKRVVVQHMNHLLKKAPIRDLEIISKVSAVAQYFLASLLLKFVNHLSVDCDDVMLNFVKVLINSPFIIVNVTAKAIACHLQSSCHVVIHGTELTNNEADFLAELVHSISHDSFRKKYNSSIVFNTLTNLCLEPMNTSLFANHRIVTNLQLLMESAVDMEAVVAVVLYKIICNDTKVEHFEEPIDTPLQEEKMTESQDTVIDLSLEGNQGHCYTFEQLFTIVTEFINLYLDCSNIFCSQARTCSAVSQCLLQLLHVMERKEISSLADCISQRSSILNTFKQVLSTNKMWCNISDGIAARESIERILILLADGSANFCLALTNIGCLMTIADGINGVLDFKASAVDTKCLQNHVTIVYKCARMCPLQAGFQLNNLDFQPLLKCPVMLVRMLSKFTIALLADYFKITNEIGRQLSLQNDEVEYLANSLFSDLSYDSVFSNVSEILHSLQCLTSLSIDKLLCGLPILLDPIISLCYHQENFTAQLALKVLLNLSLDPALPVFIQTRNNVLLPMLQQARTYDPGLSDLISWRLKVGNVEDQFALIGSHSKVSINENEDDDVYSWYVILLSSYLNSESDASYICNMPLTYYQSGNYEKAEVWCTHLLGLMDKTNSFMSTIKACKAKAMAHIYLRNHNQYLLGSSIWACNMNDPLFGAEIHDESYSIEPQVGSVILKRLSADDMETLCHLGLQVIELLGELLDSNELDEEGSYLLDWVMMYHNREHGPAILCNRCLLCRAARDLDVETTLGGLPFCIGQECTDLQFLRRTMPSIKIHNVFSLQSYLYQDGIRLSFVFCSKCLAVVNNYLDVSENFLHDVGRPNKLPVCYDRSVYLSFVSNIITSLPLAYSHFVSNHHKLYATFLACRQALLCPNMDSTKMTIPSIYLINYPNCCFVFNNATGKLSQSSMVMSKLSAAIRNPDINLCGIDSHRCTFFVVCSGDWHIVMNLYSDKDILPQDCLIHPDGGSYTLSSLQGRSQAFLPSMVHVFQNLALVEQQRHAFQSFTSNLKDKSRVISNKFKCLLPYKRLLSFLPEQFEIKLNRDNTIATISLPKDHSILCHTHDHDKDLTLFVVLIRDAKIEEEQVYLMLSCKINDYHIVDAMNITASMAVPELTSSFLADGEVNIVFQQLASKFGVTSAVTSFLQIFYKYRNIQASGMCRQRDIPSYMEPWALPDSRCSQEECWYCKKRCYVCFKPATIGYAYETTEGELLQHCSKKCFKIHEMDVNNATVIYSKVGEVPVQPSDGSYLLLYGVVVLKADTSKIVVKIMLSVSYNFHSIPNGVVYAQFYTNTGLFSPVPVYIQHDFLPVKHVFNAPVLPETVFQTYKDHAIIQKALQSLLDNLGYKDLPTFCFAKFPSSNIKFMGLDEKIYAVYPTDSRGEYEKVDNAEQCTIS